MRVGEIAGPTTLKEDEFRATVNKLMKLAEDEKDNEKFDIPFCLTILCYSYFK